MSFAVGFLEDVSEFKSFKVEKAASYLLLSFGYFAFSVLYLFKSLADNLLLEFSLTNSSNSTNSFLSTVAAVIAGFMGLIAGFMGLIAGFMGLMEGYSYPT